VSRPAGGSPCLALGPLTPAQWAGAGRPSGDCSAPEAASHLALRLGSGLDAAAGRRRRRSAGLDGYLYNSTTRQTFLFNVSYQTFDAAEQSCKDNGGHLASYSSEAEQAEVGGGRSRRPPGACPKPSWGPGRLLAERRLLAAKLLGSSAGMVAPAASDAGALPPPPPSQGEGYYAASGFLFPSFHRFYWIGLNTSNWPTDGLTSPDFTWHDESPGPNNMTYSHWGL
jgi:hypothetical protein